MKKMHLHLGDVISKKGFTLVEILVVIVIVAIVGTIMVVIFSNTLRGSNKSQILSIIKQNGQSVLENMDKTIRGADNLLCPTGTDPDVTIVTVKNGIYTRYRIVPASDTSADDKVPKDCIESEKSKNGCIVQDHPEKQIIDEVTGELETDAVFIDSVCSSDDPMPRSGSDDAANILTDTNVQTGVLIGSGFFTVSKPFGFKAIVTINFVLKPGVSAPQVIASQIDPQTYQTTIELR
ncbi:prepilin-type N-terminal cleavage/methylation domain-containing protein [Patescibacteria group bacterium]|nr:prepilin-type N-terminal cleavage/methylation domain-containing protein [Patescibacteria group bacterium]